MQTTLVGDAKRTYNRIKTGLSKDEEIAVVKHLLSLSERALGKFTEVYENEALTPSTRGIVKLQREQLLQIHRRIESETV